MHSNMVSVLDIEHDYRFMDPALVELLGQIGLRLIAAMP
jgi:predicted protein tyrosine phosphatase